MYEMYVNKYFIEYPFDFVSNQNLWEKFNPFVSVYSPSQVD